MTSLLLKSFLALLLTANCFAASPAFIGTTGLGPESAACSFSTSDADILGESFEGANSGYDNASWTETVAGTSSVDPDAAHPGSLSCADKCSHAVKVISDGSNSAKTNSPTFTESSTLYTQVYLYVDAEGLSDTDVQSFFSAYTGSTLTWYLRLYQVSGGINLYLYYWNGSANVAYATTSSISIQTWYRVSIRWVSGGSSKLYVNGTEVGTGFTAGSRNIDNVVLGTGAPTKTFTVYYDNLKLDNDTMPGACP